MSEDAKGLLDWFGKRKEGVVQDGMRAHALATLDCVTELGNTMRSMEAGDTAGASKAIERLYACEHEADTLEENLCNQLSLGELNPQEREDLLHFVKKTDAIANWCKEAAIHIQLARDVGAVIPMQIWTMFVSATSDLESEVNGLINAIKILTEGRDGIDGCIMQVKKQERSIDSAYMVIASAAFGPNMDHRGTMITMRILDAIEEAADTCKGCAETISILFYAKRI